MSFFIKKLTSGADTTNASPWLTGSITPSSNRLILAFIGNTSPNAVPASTLSGNNLNWVKVVDLEYGSGAAGRHLTLLRASAFQESGTPTTGQVTISNSGVGPTGVTWSIFEVAGVDITLKDGVVQSATNKVVAGASVTVTLGGFSHESNACIAGFGADSGVTGTPGAGFTEIDDIQLTNPGQMLETNWKDSRNLTPSCTFGGTLDGGGIAIEVKTFIQKLRIAPQAF